MNITVTRAKTTIFSGVNSFACQKVSQRLPQFTVAVALGNVVRDSRDDYAG